MKRRNESEHWSKVHGYEVYVEEDRVVRAIKLDNNKQPVTAYPYKWDKALRCWTNATGVKLSTLRSGMSRGTYSIK